MTQENRAKRARRIHEFEAAIRGFISLCFGLDCRSLALLRIGTGVCVLLNLMVRVPDISSMYTEAGCLPEKAVLALNLPSAFWSVYSVCHDYWSVSLLFIVTALLALLLTIGFQTRYVAIGLWVLFVSLLNRNTTIIDSQETLLRMLLFWGMFLPWGAVWSYDAWRGKTDPPSVQVVSPATAAYTLQIVLVYLCTAILKDAPQWRVDGTAGLYSLNMDYVTTHLGVQMTANANFLKIMTILLLVFEFVGPFMLICPFWNGLVRMVAIILFSAMHIGLSLMFKLEFFQVIDIVSLCALLPPAFWNRLAGAQIKTGLAQSQTLIDGFLGFLRNAFICFVAAMIVSCNMNTIVSKIRIPSWMDFAVDFLRLDQNWWLFGSFLPQLNGYYVVVGTLKNGAQVDLFRGGKPVDWERPRYVSDIYPNRHWRIYMVSMIGPKNECLRPYFSAYMARQWNINHQGEERLARLQMYYMYEGPLPETIEADRHAQKLLLFEQFFD